MTRMDFSFPIAPARKKILYVRLSSLTCLFWLAGKPDLPVLSGWKA